MTTTIATFSAHRVGYGAVVTHDQSGLYAWTGRRIRTASSIAKALTSYAIMLPADGQLSALQTATFRTFLDAAEAGKPSPAFINQPA